MVLNKTENGFVENIFNVTYPNVEDIDTVNNINEILDV